jgi:hypothetical protein
MRQLLLILLTGLFLGCGSSDRPSKPENLIPKEKMSEIIYDVFILNAAKGINKRILEQNGVFPQKYVFEKHKIDSLQFAMSNDFYSYDTKTYEGIMERVKQKIEAEKKKNEVNIKKEEKTKDSLKLLKIKRNDSLPKVKTLIHKLDTVSKPKIKQKSKTFGKNKD